MLAGEDIALGAAVRTHAKQRVIVIHPASMPEASGDTIRRPTVRPKLTVMLTVRPKTNIAIQHKAP
jgi:hypothetical protein